MSTRSRRPRDVLPDWLLSRPIAAFARRSDRSGKSVSDRVMASLTVDQRKGLDRIAEAAKRAEVPLGEPDIVRVAIDRMLADFEAAQHEHEGEGQR